MFYRIKNLEEYITSFDINIFVNSIKINLSTFHHSRVRRDDCWGVNYFFESLPKLDPYFRLINKVELPNIGWFDYGYTSGYQKEQEILKNIEQELTICKSYETKVKNIVLDRYDKQKHYDTLQEINLLHDEELSELQNLSINGKITAIRVIETGNVQLYSLSNSNSGSLIPISILINLLKKGIIANYFKQIFSDSENEVRYVKLKNTYDSENERYLVDFDSIVDKLIYLKENYNL